MCLDSVNDTEVLNSCRRIHLSHKDILSPLSTYSLNGKAFSDKTYKPHEAPCFPILCLLFYSRCFVDCGAVVAASNKLRVTSECLNSPCNGSVYEWRLKRLDDNSGTWNDIPILPNMTSTAINATNMIIKKNSLQSKSRYSLTLFVTSADGTEGFAVLNFETAGAPHSGYCTPSATEGVVLKTEFSFKCFDWQDTNPLTYEFQLGEEPISYGSSPKSASTVLPAGAPEVDYQLQINIVIKNAVGVAVATKLFIKVPRLIKTRYGKELCLQSSPVIDINLVTFKVHHLKGGPFILFGRVVFN